MNKDEMQASIKAERDAMRDPIHVLWWRYSDGSSAGVIRAYDDEQAGRADMAMLMEHGSDKVFGLTPVPHVKEPA